MGMDVFGKAPVSETGEYFRNNVWWWRPLWDYCCSVSELARSVEHGHDNSGDGLGAEGAQELAKTLIIEIGAGRTLQYQEDYRKEIAELPRETCQLCEGTGIRTLPSPSGEDFKMYEKALTIEQQALYGRTHGWCNGCDGAGDKPHWASNYPFSVENVQEFADFLQDSGGFEIC